MKKSYLFFFSALLSACSTTTLIKNQSQSNPAQNSPSTLQASGALKELYTLPAFKLPAAQLAIASKGEPPKLFNRENLLLDNRVSIDSRGRMQYVLRFVWRVTSDDPNQTISETWTPWREDRPEIRARVVSPDGHQIEVAPSSFVETTLAEDLELSDARQIKVPLPQVKRNSVVEYQVTHRYRKPLIDGLGYSRTFPLWAPNPFRLMRFSVEVPESQALKIYVRGVESPKIIHEGKRQRFVLKVPEIRFKAFQYTPEQLKKLEPRFGWTTNESWKKVAKAYQTLIAAKLKNQPIPDSLSRKLASLKTNRDKAQAVISFMAKKLRYTAVHLGDGSIVPTQAEKVLSRGYGDCKDLSVLLLTLLRSAGVPAQLALTQSGGMIPIKQIPGLEQFNHMIVSVINPDGSRLWVDPTDPLYPVGILPIPDRNQYALLVNDKSESLVPTPESSQTPFIIRKNHELKLSPFGEGSAKAKIIFEGAAAAMARHMAETCDKDSAKRLVEDEVKTMHFDSSFEASLSHCQPSTQPLMVDVQVADSKSLDTGDLFLRVPIFSRDLMEQVLPEAFFKDPKGHDERSEQLKTADNEKLKKATGYTEEDLSKQVVTLDSQIHVERIIRIILPEGFLTTKLPSGRTLNMGAATWTEKFQQKDEHTIDVNLALDIKKTAWTPEETDAFRKAFKNRYSEPAPMVVASFAPLKLIEDKRPKAGIQKVSKWLKQHPQDGITRARFARVLMRLQLADLAKRQAQLALKSKPNDPLVLMVAGDIARTNPRGLYFVPPFDRKKAIQLLQKARELLPEHPWPTKELAETLRRDQEGELQRAWNKDTQRAAALLKELIDTNREDEETKGNLVDIYVRTGQTRLLKELLDTHKKLLGDTAQAWILKDAMTGDTESLRYRIERTDKENKPKILAFAYATLSRLEMYDKAIALVESLQSDDDLKQVIKVLKVMNEGLKPIPEKTSTNSVEDAGKALCATLARATSRIDASKRLARLASKTGRKELDGTSSIFDYVKLPPLDNPYLYVQLFHRGKCVRTGNEKLARLKCELPMAPSTNITSYWIRADGKYRLESLGRVSSMASIALAHAKAGHLEEAKLWLDWILDELRAREIKNMGSSTFTSYWNQISPKNQKAIRYAAILTQLIFEEQIKSASKAVIEKMHRGLKDLSGAMRRLATLSLAEVYDARKDYNKAISVLRPVAKSENEPWMWRMMATYMSHAGHWKKAFSIVDKALGRDPDNVDWQRFKANLLLDKGEFKKGDEILTALRQKKGHEQVDTNNLLWARAMSNHLDEQSEQEALRLSAQQNLSSYELGTLAMVFLERGMINKAAENMNHRLVVKTDDDEDAKWYWLYCARLLQILGLDEEARKAYNNFDPKSPQAIASRKALLANPPHVE